MTRNGSRRRENSRSVSPSCSEDLADAFGIVAKLAIDGTTRNSSEGPAARPKDAQRGHRTSCKEIALDYKLKPRPLRTSAFTAS